MSYPSVTRRSSTQSSKNWLSGRRHGVFSDDPFVTDHESGLDDVFQTAVGSPEQYDSAYETNGSLGDWPNGFWYADRTLEWVDDRESEWAACINRWIPTASTNRSSSTTNGATSAPANTRSRWTPSSTGTFSRGSISTRLIQPLEQIYDGAVRQADAIFETLIRGLDEQGVLEDTLVVFVGDHGEGFGEPTAIPEEPPAVSHRIGTHDSMYHVPLVVRAPGQREGHRITDLATLSRFPDAVRAMALGDGNADGPAFASPNGTSSRHRPPSARQCARRPNGSWRRCPDRKTCSPGLPRPARRRGPKTGGVGRQCPRIRHRRRGGTVEDRDIDAAVVRNHFDSDRYADVAIATPLDGYTEFEDASDTQFAGDLDDRLEALGYK